MSRFGRHAPGNDHESYIKITLPDKAYTSAFLYLICPGHVHSTFSSNSTAESTVLQSSTAERHFGIVVGRDRGLAGHFHTMAVVIPRDWVISQSLQGMILANARVACLNARNGQ